VALRAFLLEVNMWKDLSDEERQPYIDLAIQILSNLWYCTRVWSAWSYNTMTQDDFIPANEDDDIINNTACIIYMKNKGLNLEVQNDM
jgi:hypothetical protein